MVTLASYVVFMAIVHAVSGVVVRCLPPALRAIAAGLGWLDDLRHPDGDALGL